MVSGETPQTWAGQTESGRAGSLSTVPFEVVRRTEFVFDPFLGSLIQLPEAAGQRAQSSEFFLPQSPPTQTEVLQNEALPSGVQAEVRLDAVMRIASAVEPKAQERPAASAVAETIEETFGAEPVAERVANEIRQTPLVQEQWQIAEAAPRTTEKPSLAMRIGRWLWGNVEPVGESRRRAERRVVPGLLAFYWSGGTPKPHEVVNISKTGFYMRTTELWSVETLVRMTLQRPRREDRLARDSVGVLARVVRIDEGGVGHEFVTTEALMAARSLDVMPSQGTNWKELDKFLEAS
jgi:hypothetical protein